ncbi:MAG: hypothetical protein ACKVHX_16125 [Alphaproteobacteria bacterium]|jgi:hypothetical protein
MRKRPCPHIRKLIDKCHGNDIMDEIVPSAQDIVIRKIKPSAFYGTKSINIDHVIQSLQANILCRKCCRNQKNIEVETYVTTFTITIPFEEWA